MRSIRRMNYNEVLEFMKKNRLKEFTYKDGTRIYWKDRETLYISFGEEGDGLDFKFYMGYLEALALIE